MNHVAAALARHEAGRIVLQFSGGKDSLAVLHLLRPYWRRILVLWTNPGAPLPETVEQMRVVRALVPHFVEVVADQPAQVAANGYPLDVVPVMSTAAAQSLIAGDHADRIRFQPVTACCAENLWAPMQRFVQESGATLVIRGQKASDARRGRLRSGDVVAGVEYLYPIEDWTDAQVLSYLANCGIALPVYYQRGLSGSPDCWNCTAHGTHAAELMRYLPRYHPEKWQQIRPVLAAARAAIRADSAWMDAALNQDA